MSNILIVLALIELTFQHPQLTCIVLALHYVFNNVITFEKFTSNVNIFYLDFINFVQINPFAQKIVASIRNFIQLPKEDNFDDSTREKIDNDNETFRPFEPNKIKPWVTVPLYHFLNVNNIFDTIEMVLARDESLIINLEKPSIELKNISTVNRFLELTVKTLQTNYPDLKIVFDDDEAIEDLGADAIIKFIKNNLPKDYDDLNQFFSAKDFRMLRLRLKSLGRSVDGHIVQKDLTYISSVIADAIEVFHREFRS